MGYSTILSENASRIGAPISSRGEGIAHPRSSRHDIQSKPAGNGNEVVLANVMHLLMNSKNAAEAIKAGVAEDVAVLWFETSGKARSALENK